MTEPEKIKLREVLEDLVTAHSEAARLNAGPLMHLIVRSQSNIQNLLNPITPTKERS